MPGASNSFLIAGLRVTPERWNKEANFQKIEHWAREAAAPTLAAPKNCLLVVFISKVEFQRHLDLPVAAGADGRELAEVG